MPVGATIGAGALTAGATVYSANKASKAGNIQDPYNEPRTSTYGSMIRRERAMGPAGGSFIQTTFDPSIRSLREQVLGRLPGYRSGISSALSGYGSNLDDVELASRGIYNDLSSNENPFIQARVNPLLARAAEARGMLGRSLVSRGLGGSSLYSTGLGNYDAGVGREIADQGALATSESLNARRASLGDITGLDTQRYNSALSALQAFQSMDSQEQSIAAQNLSQELQALGMSADSASAALAAAGLRIQQQQLQASILGRGADTLGRVIGSYQSNPTATGESYSVSNPGAVI